MSTLKANLQINPQDIYTASTTQQTDLGAFATTGDGRAFRYVLASGTAALVPGKLYAAPAQDTTNFQNLIPNAAVAIGGKSVVLNSSVTLSANQFAGGVMVVRAGTGAGYTYQVASNTAVSASTGATVTLADPIVVALDTTSRLDFNPQPFNGVIINPTSATSIPVGVAIYAIPASQYGWIQTCGHVGALAQGAITVGVPVGPSLTTAGALTTSGGTTPSVGIAAQTIASGSYGEVFLLLS